MEGVCREFLHHWIVAIQRGTRKRHCCEISGKLVISYYWTRPRYLKTMAVLGVTLEVSFQPIRFDSQSSDSIYGQAMVLIVPRHSGLGPISTPSALHRLHFFHKAKITNKHSILPHILFSSPTSDEMAPLSSRAKANIAPSYQRSFMARVFSNPYNAETNPNGIFQMGLAENKLMSLSPSFHFPLPH